MSNDGPAGLIPRRIVDRIAFGIFIVFLIFFLSLLLTGQSSHKPQATTTSTTTSLQVVSGPHGLEHRTQTTQKVTSEAVPPVWESLLGNRQTVFLICAAALLAAYFLAAIMQRILLGKYAIGIGPLSVPDLITQQEVSDAVTEALTDAERVPTKTPPSGTPAPESEPEPEVKTPESSLESKTAPAWVNVTDPNLALAGYRIDLEKELRRIAEEFHFPGRDQRTLRSIVSRLSDMEIIPHSMANSLQDLLTIANQGVHGAMVDEGVITVLRTQGLDLLAFLRTIRG